MSQHVYERPEEGYDDEIDIAALLLVIWGYRRLIASIVVFFMSIVILLSLFTTRRYTATTTIINMVDNKVVKNVQGFDFDTVVQSPKNDILLAILESDSLRVQIIKKANLLPKLFPKRWDEEKKAWKLKFEEKAPTDKMGAEVLKKRIVKIKSTDKDPTITINVTTNNPELSALIANTYTSELEEYLKNNSFSTVQKSRVFLEGKVKESKEALDAMKLKMEEFQTVNGVFDLDQQAEASMRAYNELALQLNQLETQLSYIQSISSSMNPRVKSLSEQINAIKNKMQELKSGKGMQLNGENFLPLNKIPELRLQLGRITHDIENQQKTYDILIENYEKIAIQEARDKIFVTVLDQAEVPRKPDGKRTLVKLFLAIFGGGFLGICIAFGLEFFRKNMEVKLENDGTNDMAVKPEILSEPFKGIDSNDGEEGKDLKKTIER
jgi:uncharacterized protein involved in exopolysaccharide biosynthesis